MPDSAAPQQSIYPLRLLLAALFLLGSKGLLWTFPTEVGEWLVAVVGSAAIATLFLDMAARYRVRDGVGWMALVGVAALFSAALLDPQVTLADVPRTLFTRVMGATALVYLLLSGVWWYAARGRVTRLASAGLLISVLLLSVGGWVWQRYAPVFIDLGATPSDAFLPEMLVTGAVTLLLLFAVARRSVLPATYLRMTPIEGGIVAIIFIGLFALRLAQGALDGVSLTLIGFIAAICWGIAYFQRREKGRTLLDVLSYPPQFLIIGVVAVALLLAVVILALVPLAEPSAVDVMSTLFTIFGYTWLPFITIIIGARAFIRQARMNNL